eukprot:gene6039-6741_t
MSNPTNIATSQTSFPQRQDGRDVATGMNIKAVQEQARAERQQQQVFVPTSAPQDVADSSDDEDVHQCGRCKDIFRNLQLYMEHKASKICKNQNKSQQPNSRQSKPDTQISTSSAAEKSDQAPQHHTIRPANILEEAAKDTIYKQLEILVVDEEPEQERQSTIDAQSISSGDTDHHHHNNNPVTYVAIQDKGTGPVKMNAPITMVNTSEASNNKKAPISGRGRPRKSQPLKLASPVGDSPTNPVSEASPDFAVPDNREPGTPGSRKRAKPCHIVPTDIVPLTGDDVNDNEDHDTDDPAKKHQQQQQQRQNKLKRVPTSFPCSICKLEFITKQHMLEHRGKHTKLFKCKVCSEGFYTEEKLNKHTEKETHSYPCEHCGKVLVSKASLQRHKVVHGEKTHICDVCNRAFKTARDMKNHKLGVHSEEKNFVCESCGKGFARREKLKRHSLIHSPNRPVFTCPFKNHTGCDKVFYRKDKLTRHLYSHSKIKPFKCDHCMKTFARTDNLREHMRTHTGVFRYYCTICGKGQPGPKKYQQHMLKQHNIENFEVPSPLEENAPPELIEQHRAIVMAETEARASRGAKNRKKSVGDMVDAVNREHEAEADFQPSLHHTTMVTSYSTVSLRDIDPTASLSTGAHHLLHATAVAADQPSTPTTIHPRPPMEDGGGGMRVPGDQHEPQKHDYAVSEMGRNVLDMVRQADMGRGSVPEMSHANVSDMGRASVPAELTRSDGRSVSEINRNVADMNRGVQDMRMKVSELNRSIEVGRGDMPRVIPPELVRRNPQEMQQQRSGEIGSNIMVPPSSHAERSNIMPPASHADRPNIMVSASHAERGSIMVPTSDRVGIHLLPQSVIQQNMHFTNLLNSDLASIGEAVVRNQSLPVMSSIFKTFHGQSMQ